MPGIPSEVMAWTAGILLGVYVLGILYALTRKPTQPDPQRGQAIGCLWIVVIGLLVLGGVLAVAVRFDLGWLVRVVFWLTVFPFISLVGSGVLHVVKKVRG